MFRLRRRARRFVGALKTSNLAYRLSLFRYWPRGVPDAPWRNAVLKTRSEWEAACEQTSRLRLPLHPSPEKNWDSLAMLACVLDRMPRSAKILDAGGATYSVLLPWLFLYGYRNLTSVNLSFPQPFRRGPIRYEPGDITRLSYPQRSFDVVICQSVLEHGVDVDAFLREASRILAPQGLLMISMDYFCEPIDTEDLRPFGLPYHVFTPDDVRSMIRSADALGLRQTDPINLACEERAVWWPQVERDFTFILLTFVKTERSAVIAARPDARAG